MKFQGETILEMMGAHLLPREGEGFSRQCAVILTENGLYVAEGAPTGKEVHAAESVPMKRIHSIARLEPEEPGETKRMRMQKWVDARTWPKPVKGVARVLLPPLAGFFSYLADHFTRREEMPEAQLCVRYVGEDGGAEQRLTFIRCEDDIDLMLRAWQRQRARCV